MTWPLASRDRAREQELDWHSIRDPMLDNMRWGRCVEQAIRDLDYHFAEIQARKLERRGPITIPIRTRRP